MISLASISTFFVFLVIKYRYFFLYPVTIVEGPLVTFVSGFLVSTGAMNPLIAFPIIVAGDLSGDAIYYFLGRFGGRRAFSRAIIKYCGFETMKSKIEKLFESHGGKFLLFGKLTHALGAVFLIGAGYSRMDFRRFILYNLIGTIIKSSLLLYAGYLAGSAYGEYAKKFEYGAFYVTIISLAIIILSFLVSRYFFYRVTKIKDLGN